MPMWLGGADSQKGLAIAGSAWTVIGFGGSQIIRLGSNLVLTRFLMPEIFGVMALIQVVIQAIQMLSDIGISTSVIRAKQGDDPDYLDTAWTLQVLRGLLIWVFACSMAYPMSIIYEAAELLLLIPVVAMSGLIQGFQSPAILTLRRHINIKGLVGWQIASQSVTTLITIVAVWHFRSIWAIAVGGVLGAFIGCLMSYKFPRLSNLRFKLDGTAQTDILNFGKWIFVSSFISFFINKGDILILGISMTKAELGVFSIAAIWARVALDLLLKLNSQVLTPLYAIAFRHDDVASINVKIHKARMGLLIISLPICWILIVGSHSIIGFLYDPRYASAGWMLQILGIGTVAAAITAASANALLAFGDSFSFMLFQAIRGALLVACMSFGGVHFGVIGLIAGISISKFISYPFLAVLLHRHKIWLPSLDCWAFLISTIVVGSWFWWMYVYQ